LISRTKIQVNDGMATQKSMKSGSAAEIARNWQLESGIGFLLRLLEARYDVLYQNLTGQSDITPRQFGAHRIISARTTDGLGPRRTHQLRSKYT
jgi:hypothetical protein